jgi:uncharacterized membrane protein
VHDKTTYSLSYINSVERDYISNTTHFSLSQDMFGDLTTLTLGFSHPRQGRREQRHGVRARRQLARSCGEPQLRHRVADSHQEPDRGVNFDVITDDGYLGQSLPILSVLARSAAISPRAIQLAARSIPTPAPAPRFRARRSTTCPIGAAVTGSTGTSATPGASSATPTSSTTPTPSATSGFWKGPVPLLQTEPRRSFYSDLFPYAGSQNFMARDQDLAARNNTTIGAKATYAFLPDGWKMFKRGTVTLDISRITFNYSDFTDIKDFGQPEYPPGGEPLYHFDATVFQAYMSVFF